MGSPISPLLANLFMEDILPEKQVIKPIVTSEAKGTFQIEPRLGQDRTGLRWKHTLPHCPH